MKNKYGIYRTETRARFFRTTAGFLSCPISGKVQTFNSANEAASFLRSELAQSVGKDYEIREVVA